MREGKRFSVRPILMVMGVVSLLGAASGAAGAEFPTKAIEFIIPFGAGGSADIEGRIIAKAAEKILGQPVVPINKPGAGGALAYTHVKSAAPDGYTVAWNSTSLLTTTELGNVDFRWDALDPVCRVSIQAMPLVRYLRTGQQPGFQFRRAATYTHYPCADGRYIAIAANDQEMWERMCDAICPSLKADPRFVDPFDRASNKMALVDVLAEIFLQRPCDEWAQLLADSDVPNAPVLAYEGVAQHPQFWANGYIQEIEHQNLGKMRVHGPPVGMSGTPAKIQGGGPELGQNTEEILLAAGYTWEELEAFNRAGVIQIT